MKKKNHFDFLFLFDILFVFLLALVEECLSPTLFYSLYSLSLKSKVDHQKCQDPLYFNSVLCLLCFLIFLYGEVQVQTLLQKLQQWPGFTGHMRSHMMNLPLTKPKEESLQTIQLSYEVELTPSSSSSPSSSVDEGDDYNDKGHASEITQRAFTL